MSEQPNKPAEGAKPEGEGTAPGAKKVYQRSPGYPGITLEAAILRAERLYQKETKNWAHIDVVLSDIGYNTPTGDALRTVAALEKYGLIEDKGKGDQRQARLTTRGLDIVLAEKESAEYATAIKEAALLPGAFLKVWNHFEGNLPSDQALTRYLIHDGFTKLGAATFIKVLRANIAYANRFDGGNMSESEDSRTSAETTTGGGQRAAGGGQTVSAQHHTTTTPTQGYRKYPIPISDADNIVIEGPFPMTPEQWEMFQVTLDAWQKVLVKAPAKPESHADQNEKETD